jgi:hypothetical protein
MTANIQRGHVTHGIYGWLRTGKINPSVRGFKRLQRYLRDIEKNLTADLGGVESISAAQEILIKSTVQALGVLLLAGAYTQRYSILDPAKARRGILELQPVLGRSYIAFLNTIRCNLVALGLDRKKAEEALDLGKYLSQTYGNGSQAGQGEDGQEQAKETDQAEKTQPGASGETGEGSQGEGGADE